MNGQELTHIDDPEARLREQAIDLYIGGSRPTAICRQLSRSRTWFYNTLTRYRQGGRQALLSRSRAPQHIHNRTAAETEAAIVRLRKTIVSGDDPELRYANMGADALAVELEHAGITPPHRVTITRILKRHGLIQPRRRKSKKRKLPDDYPWPDVQNPNDVHLFDFVIRSIRGAGRVYSFNLLDQARRWPFLRAETPKNADNVCQFLVSAWQEIGLPGALYLDNDAVWNGGGRGQRVLSTVVRLCLLVGVEVIFIFIRFVSSTGAFSVLNEQWQLDAHLWAGKTIRATVDTQQQQLLVYHQTKGSAQCQRIAQFDYPLGEPTALLAEAFQRPSPTLWPPTEQPVAQV